MTQIKLLYILNFAQRLNHFSHASMLAAKAQGFSFHVACNWKYPSDRERREDEVKHGIRIHQVDFCRNPLHPGNVKAYRQISTLMAEEHFDLLHCNTPIGGALGRLAAKRHRIASVIYQAHGFHFYQGAPKINWLTYYPIEKMLARLTDILITINEEDDRLARRAMHLRSGGFVHYVPGIGVDTKKYSRSSFANASSRTALKLPEGVPLILSVGELNRNKNHEVIIRALPELPGVQYAIAGEGSLKVHLQQVAAALGVEGRVHFLGFRTDVTGLYSAADMFCLPSYREGLSASVMEAMASGLPIIASDIRGNRDLIVEEQGGYLVAPDDISGFAASIRALNSNQQVGVSMGAFNAKRIENFSLDHVSSILETIYRDAVTRIRGE